MLQRYTSIPALLKIIKKSELTLVDPEYWDDTNDSHAMRIYKDRANIKTLLALCFTEASETYHHWHVFAGDSSGVRITFNKKKLLEHFTKTAGYSYNLVAYRTLDQLRQTPPAKEELPFLKRYGFSDEREFRILYESKKQESSAKDISITLDCIEEITLSPWMHPALADNLQKIIKEMIGAESSIDVHHSTLIGNKEWKKMLNSVPERQGRRPYVESFSKRLGKLY